MVTPTLDAFQLDTLDFLDDARGRAIVADPMGARKTGTVLAWINRADLMRTLIVAPSAVHGHWAREAARFAPTYAVVHGTGTKKQRLDAIARTAQPGCSAIHIVTYEGMKLEQAKLLAVGFDCVVFDEGHKLKGRTTQVALASNAFAKACEHCIIVTGTPVLNHAVELWQYLHMVAPDVYTERGKGRFWLWAEEHFKVEIAQFRNARFPVKIVHGFRNGHEEIVRTLIEPFFIQRQLSEMFPDEPWIAEPEHVEISVELTKAERKAYDNLVKFKWALVGGNEVSTSNALDLATRLRQITSDWGGLDDLADHGAKVSATVELVNELLERGEQVVVFAQYRATVRRIVEALHGRAVAAFTGDQRPEELDARVASFADGKLDVLVGTLDALAEGVDGLQRRCSNVIMHDRFWTPAKNDQAIGRVRRSGQLKLVTVYHVFAENTIDETITAACLRKTNVIEMLRGRPLVDSLYGRFK